MTKQLKGSLFRPQLLMNIFTSVPTLYPQTWSIYEPQDMIFEEWISSGRFKVFM